MTQSGNQRDIIIRFSSTWWVYMFARGGSLRGLVNGIEDVLAITGRILLLAFLVYSGIKSGALLVMPTFAFPMWMEMLMFGLQLLGLEGSLPGLSRHAETLRERGDQQGASKVRQVMKSARWMTFLTIGEGVLHLFGIDPTYLRIISGLLLLVRGYVITSFLMELAKVESHGPRVLSQKEYDREQEREAREGEQAR